MSTENRRNVVQEQRKTLTDRLNFLLNLWTIANHELNTMPDGVDRQIKQEQIKDLDRQMKEVEKQLKDLDSERDLYGTYLRNWKNELHNLDLKKVKTISSKIVDRFEDRGGNVLFLMKNGNSMGGEWCIHKLKDTFFHNKKNTRHFPLRFLDFQSVDPASFLNKFSESLGIPARVIYSSQEIDRILETLENSLVAGGVYFLEIGFHSRSLQDGFIPWLLQEFWIKLIDRINTVSSQKPLIRLLAIVEIENEISKGFIESSFCCTLQQLDCHKFLELPLKRWTEAEIKTWLIEYSGLLSPPIEYTSQQIQILANSIYEDSKGKPKDVYGLLERKLQTISQSIQ